MTGVYKFGVWLGGTIGWAAFYAIVFALIMLITGTGFLLLPFVWATVGSSVTVAWVASKISDAAVQKAVAEAKERQNRK